jgi:hypothetical protein
MRQHKEMLKSGKVSIWIGNIASEEGMLSYVDDGDFGRDFDFEINPESGRELKAESHSVEASQLVHGFSSWKSFASECVQSCHNLGFDKATSMLVLYAFEYQPTSNINPNAQLNFVGVYDY